MRAVQGRALDGDAVDGRLDDGVLLGVDGAAELVALAGRDAELLAQAADVQAVSRPAGRRCSPCARMRLSRTSTAPTWRRRQVERVAA